MADDVEFRMTYPCYFLLSEGGGLQCNTVDGNGCLADNGTPQARERLEMLAQHPNHQIAGYAQKTARSLGQRVRKKKSSITATSDSTNVACSGDLTEPSISSEALMVTVYEKKQ